jgi:phage terminase large subunit-like protein
VLTWAAANAVIVEDDAGNRKLSKAKATGRIDPLLAAIMAVGQVARAEPPLSLDDFLANPVMA